MEPLLFALFCIPVCSFAPLWFPPLVGLTPSRDPLVSFVRGSMRDEPEAWQAVGGYPLGYMHTSGLLLRAGVYRASIEAPQEVTFSWPDRRRLKATVGRWERHTRRLANARARVAAIETIVGKKIA